jgi:nascent polypeptide-associated complex subunit alpha
MIPGNIDPRKLKRMMDQLGIRVEDIEDVEKVRIVCKERIYDFDQPSVSMMRAQGQTTFQISGGYKISGRISEGDIALVAEQANVSEEEAKRALKKCNNNPAEAIVWLIEAQDSKR